MVFNIVSSPSPHPPQQSIHSPSLAHFTTQEWTRPPLLWVTPHLLEDKSQLWLMAPLAPPRVNWPAGPFLLPVWISGERGGLFIVPALTMVPEDIGIFLVSLPWGWLKRSCLFFMPNVKFWINSFLLKTLKPCQSVGPLPPLECHFDNDL